MEENGNFLHLSGVLTDNPVYGHEVFGEKFYYATLSVPRLSGAEDLLPITVSERLMDHHAAADHRLEAGAGRASSAAAQARSSRARDACSSRASRSSLVDPGTAR